MLSQPSVPGQAPSAGGAAPGSFRPAPEAIAELRAELIRTRQVPHGVEKDLVQQFIELHECGYLEDLIPLTPLCTLVCEQPFKYGRADIVAYHSDGSASVIEAKDGTRGYTHVVAGIGQATLYAVQLGLSKGAVRKVRRCLLWSSTGDLAEDCLIDMACRQAGVVSLSMGSMESMQATREAVTRLMTEVQHGCA
ncbi:hypothetical protein [Delftia acidovorans]|uniref:hypothetical protein n=1 Tax=Delftia acidovorans TaxID=80866 RepID=UPI00286F9171|nr:hypothetical protein [Delftia acidovorans]